MRIFFIHIILFLGVLSVTAQIREVKTFHDKDKTQLKEVFHFNTNTKHLEGPYTSYFFNGLVNSRGHYLKNSSSGVWEFFFESGKLKMKGALNGEDPMGPWEYFFEKGGLSMNGTYQEGNKHGLWTYYYESGSPKITGFYHQGVRDGKWEFYFQDGSLKAEIQYKQGSGPVSEYYLSGVVRAKGHKSGSENTGKWRYYHDDGSLMAEGWYEDGKRQGTWLYYHKNGAVSSSGIYEKDLPTGTWEYYYDNGQLNSSGQYEAGNQDGNWNMFNADGSSKGSIVFDDEKGKYRETYPDGALKMEGELYQGQYAGEWRYYYPGGKLQGICQYGDEGIGQYTGFYPQGGIRTSGTMENGTKVGKWNIYDKEGEVSGYYKPFYDDRNDILAMVNKPEKEVREYGVGEYLFKTKKFRYFENKINEFHGVIVSTNPLAPIIGRLPVNMEFYIHERLGHEFEFEALRDPFFANVNGLAINEVYSRGYAMAIRQKFYNPVGTYGLWYFGHELRFTNLGYFANTFVTVPQDLITVSASEQRVEYAVLVGYRIMENRIKKGFTLDAFAGAGLGYRHTDVPDHVANIFVDIPQNNFPLVFRLGLNFGYTFSFGRR